MVLTGASNSNFRKITRKRGVARALSWSASRLKTRRACHTPSVGAVLDHFVSLRKGQKRYQ